jgi:iron(III) transport system permease protein
MAEILKPARPGIALADVSFPAQRVTYTPRVPAFDRSVAGIAAVPLALTLCLVAAAVWLSFQADPGRSNAELTFGNYKTLVSSKAVVDVLGNTLVFAGVAVLVSGLFGIVAAWLVARTTMPGKLLIRTVMTLSIILPGYVAAMGWLFLFGERIGSFNALLASLPLVGDLRIDIANPIGMGVVEGFSLTPLFFIMLVDAFRSADPSLEEAAQAHGLGKFFVMARIILPLATPSILAAAFYTSMIAIGAFDVPAIIGLSGRTLTLSTYLYLLIEPGNASAPAYGVAAATGVLIVIVTVVPMLLYLRLLSRSYKYGVISGKGYRTRSIALAASTKWAAWVFLAGYFILAQILPILNTIWVSLQPYTRPMSIAAFADVSFEAYRTLSWPLLTLGFRNTAILMLTAPTIAVAFAILISWTVIRSKIWWRKIYDYVAFLPLAVPNVVFALSMLLIALFVVPSLGLYGTIYAILIVYVVSYISFATRTLNGVLIAINAELDEVASVHGINPWRKLSTIIVPLLLPTIATTWLWLALLSYRELTVASFLATRHNITLSAVIWSGWTSGGTNLSAAMTVIGLIIMTPLIALYWIVNRQVLTRVEET